MSQTQNGRQTHRVYFQMIQRRASKDMRAVHNAFASWLHETNWKSSTKTPMVRRHQLTELPGDGGFQGWLIAHATKTGHRHLGQRLSVIFISVWNPVGAGTSRYGTRQKANGTQRHPVDEMCQLSEKTRNENLRPSLHHGEVIVTHQLKRENHTWTQRLKYEERSSQLLEDKRRRSRW
jgi:hypothetical protein